MDAGLVISDLHAPYHHPDSLEFLKALKRKYKFGWVVCIGDELDNHAMSFHDSDPDLSAAGDELKKGREFLWELEKVFPIVDLVDSNHGSMHYRKGKAHGFPRHMLLGYKDVIFGEHLPDGTIARNRGDGWRWRPHFTRNICGKDVYFVHGMSVSTKRNVEMIGMNFVQGHHHGTFEIVNNGTPLELNWGMTVGCLIDDASLAFAYNKNTLKRPIIGCGSILDGQPKLLPMILEKGGRWNGETP